MRAEAEIVLPGEGRDLTCLEAYEALVLAGTRGA